MMAQFTKRQWLTLIVISIADFANAICVSLQAPFYPQEVSNKNGREGSMTRFLLNRDHQFSNFLNTWMEELFLIDLRFSCSWKKEEDEIILSKFV